jgi:tetraacyldisaccharide 4'-kinase
VRAALQEPMFLRVSRVTFAGEAFHDLVSGRARGVWPSIERSGLRLLSIPYGWGTRLQNRLFDWGWKQRLKAQVPVVSVGNLTLGGTGKTPCVEYVASFYRERDWRVAILSRGYGGEGGRNDEALLLEENLPDVPHLQGPDRATLAATAVEELESEVLVLDDGFQHRRLARDLDLVLIDATYPWGHGHLFPRGLLREPVSSLRRADLLVLTRCDQVNENERGRIREAAARHAPKCPVAETTHRPRDLVGSERRTATLDRLKDRTVAAFCGIGNPPAFRRTLDDLGAKVADFRGYPDHHPYSRNDVEDLRDWASRQATDCMVLTTQKDLVKLPIPTLGGRELWAVRIGLHFESGREELDRKLEEVVSGE